jgi:GTPase
VNYSEFTTAEEICENSTKLITFIDLAGHRKYLKTTVLGLTGYSPHHVMLVVSGSAGIVGMTHEHLALATALDVPFFITITKTDVTVPIDTLLSLEAMLKSAGCRKVMQSSSANFYSFSRALMQRKVYRPARHNYCIQWDLYHNSTDKGWSSSGGWAGNQEALTIKKLECYEMLHRASDFIRFCGTT